MRDDILWRARKSWHCPKLKGFAVAMDYLRGHVVGKGATKGQAAQAKAHSQCNINASPLSMPVKSVRTIRSCYKSERATVNCPIIYANLVVGQDELVF